MRQFALAAGLALAVTGPAAAFSALNGMQVEGDAGGFAVSARGATGPADFWCAAGDFAVRVLHLPPATPLWRLSEPPRRAGEAVRFSTSGEGAASKTRLFILGAPDRAAVSAGFAQSLCENPGSRRTRR
ncbi:MAG: hypothetical protein R3D84_09305 [Paracoccaceae bacterium]